AGSRGSALRPRVRAASSRPRDRVRARGREEAPARRRAAGTLRRRPPERPPGRGDREAHERGDGPLRGDARRMGAPPRLQAGRGGRVELTLRERSVAGHRGPRLLPLDVPAEGAEKLLPRERLRAQAPALPEISEPAAVRHFVNLSTLNHHIDKAIYPLGSC